jgi:phosphoglycolate phosphatase
LSFALYVFDLDGTLVDSRRDLAESANELLREHAAAPLREEVIGRMIGDGAAVLVARVFAASGLAQPPDALARFLAIYDTRLLNHTRPYPGIRETLDALRARARLGVLTNKPMASTRRVLSGLQLADYFDSAFVIGGDGPFPPKPDPSGLRHLSATAATTTAMTILIGDSMIDWRTARSAGTAVCLVRYGFGFEGISCDAVGPADCVIDDPIALLTM